nr:hypothetical protein [uncultured Mediterraneibacter sp.]
MSRFFYISSSSVTVHRLLFTPMSITPLIGMEDARFVLNVSRPSP